MKKVKKIALMAVGDDAWMGGIQYTLNIINAINSLDNSMDFEIHLFKSNQQKFEKLSNFSNIKLIVREVEKEFPTWKFSNRLLWFVQRKINKRINPRIETFFVHEQFDYIFPTLLSSVGNKINSGSWIADFQYHHFPDGANPAITAAAEHTISNIVNNSKKIILSSYYCQKDCHELFPASIGKTYVMPFTVSIDASIFQNNNFLLIKEKYQLPDKYIMVSNLFAPTKNHTTLFKALGIIREKGILVNLVCTGNIVDYRNQSYANEILQLITDNKIRSQVHLLGLIPRIDQLMLYRMALALVQPSINEGWSTLVEEAKALGKILILSDIPVHLEQCPGNPNFFTALDPVDLANKIIAIWNENESKTFPDSQIELDSFAKYQDQVKIFGNRFIEIAEL